ncbi:MAG: LuxR C-terminal-related transcriptional regulator [Phycisphaerales bacterium JB039]
MPGPQPYQAVWEALSKEPGIGLTIIGLDGKILYTNEEAARLYSHQDAASVVGRALDEIVPAEVAQQTLERGARCIHERRSFSSRIVWGGRQIINSYHPIKTDDEADPDHFFIISRLCSGVQAAQTDLVSEYIDLGELSGLTTRELEVLALIGQGLRIAEIAKILHRSERTIEKHRESIGRKLHQSDRVQLALLAARAGLRVEDAKLKRIQSESE